MKLVTKKVLRYSTSNYLEGPQNIHEILRDCEVKQKSLTLPVPIPDEEKKIKRNFDFHTFVVPQKVL